MTPAAPDEVAPPARPRSFEMSPTRAKLLTVVVTVFSAALALPGSGVLLGLALIIGFVTFCALINWLFNPSDGTLPIVVGLVTMATPAMFLTSGIAAGSVLACVGAVAVGELGRAVSGTAASGWALIAPATLPRSLLLVVPAGLAVAAAMIIGSAAPSSRLLVAAVPLTLLLFAAMAAARRTDSAQRQKDQSRSDAVAS